MKNMKKLTALTLALVLTFALAACGFASGKVADAFFNIFSSGSYHMKAKIVGGGAETTTETFVKRGLTATVVEAQGQTMRMVMRDNKMHMIDDAQKTVMIMSAQMHAQAGTGNTAEVNTARMRYTGSGTANFHGRNLPYDEYSIDNGKTQFFVDGNRLAGIRNIAGRDVTDIVILVLSQNVPDSVFQIPAGYTQMSF